MKREKGFYPRRYRGWSLFLAFVFFGLWAMPAICEDSVRVPIVAIDSRGEAVSGLGPDGIEVFVNGRPVESFILAKRAAGSGAPVRRTAFLVFDTLSTTHRWLSSAKNIAGSLLTSQGPGIDYLLLSLEPGSGLRYLLGPTGDREELVRTLRKKIVARQPGDALDSNPHRFDVNDGLLVGDPRTPRTQMGDMRTERDPISAPRTQLDERKKRELFLASLATLNIALTGFNDSVKTVFFFSGGIASRTQYQDLSTINPNFRAEVQTIDSLFLNSLTSLSGLIKTKGAVVFVINPAGSYIGREEPGSGENQLRLLAEKAGGRYFEGDPDVIVRRLAEIQNAYVEVVLPLDGLGSRPVDIEIRPRDPGLRLYYGHRVFPSLGFEYLDPDEKARLALDAAEGGYASQMTLGPRTAEITEKSESRDRATYRLKLPADFQGSPLDVFRVWLGKGGRPGIVETERIDPAGDEAVITVVKKKGYRSRVVIIEPRDSAALILP